MNDFLSTLIASSNGERPGIPLLEARIASRFEPPLGRSNVSGGADLDTGFGEEQAARATPSIDENPLPTRRSASHGEPMSNPLGSPRLPAPNPPPSPEIDRPKVGSANAVEPAEHRGVPRLSATGEPALAQVTIAEPTRRRDEDAGRKPLASDRGQLAPVLTWEGKEFRRDVPPLIVDSAFQAEVPRIARAITPASARTQAVAATINVTIGRVDIKAVRPAVPAASQKVARSAPAGMSLDDYLRRRAAGGAG
jgi:hypothetical protein